MGVLGNMLAGKIALVTGASRGIGRAIAVRLARGGADVIFTYLRKEAASRMLATDIEAIGQRARFVKANVGKPQDIQQLFEEVRDFGGVDILISSAATGVMEPLLQATEKHWQWTLAPNAWGFLSLVQQAAPIMSERGGGRVVALTSKASARVLDNYGLVGTSKAALESLVRYLAVELAPAGIVVNAVSPGFVDTDAARVLPNAEALLELTRKQTPAGRLTTVEDVAHVVCYLCSDQTRMIIGQTIVVDGGYSLRVGQLRDSPPTALTQTQHS